MEGESARIALLDALGVFEALKDIEAEDAAADEIFTPYAPVVLTPSLAGHPNPVDLNTFSLTTDDYTRYCPR